MDYTSLYRKFRPQTFSELVGQEHIVKTLKNEIIAGRVGHAYLFNGGRGTGKTSAAKILARAVNCLNPKDGEPCNECEVCKAALNGSLTDIVEMDAASNNSVEDVRNIRDEVNFLPTVAKYRVYIIDEVHMLSTGAFNALLKTLEEPPEHVKFILATTEPQKLPATILSRCQRFDFKKIPVEDIEKRLKFVCKQTKIDITDEALQTIAILAEGAMRDALSILERCMQEETTITEEIVKELVGIPPITSVNLIVKGILNKNSEDALDELSKILDAGKDIENLVWEITKYVKDILVYKAKGNIELYSNSEKEEIKKLADKASKEELISIIYSLSDLANQMKWSSQKNILFQVTIIKLCSEDLEVITKKEVRGKTEKDAQAPETKEKNPDNQDKKVKAEGQKKEVKIINGEKINSWNDVVDTIKQSGKMLVYSNLLNSSAVQINDMTVGITFPKGITPFGKKILEQSENINEITKQVSIAIGKPMKIKLIEENVEIRPKINSQAENISKELDIPINIIDD